MSRFPAFSAAGTATPASIFARLRERLALFQGDVIPLQIGDTHLAPPAEVAPASGPDVYAYGNPAGWQPLIDHIHAQRKQAVQITCGTTHALSCALQAIADPGDEVLLLTPHWPLIKGIALAQNVVPVEVPFHDLDAIAAAITPRTAAIYYATPNNPDGEMLSADEVRAIAALAEQHGLWILADEVYEHYCYDAPHVAVAPLAGERAITVFSFAKSYALAGLRVGYLLGSPRVVDTVKKLVNHSVYNVPVATQRAALAAMQEGDAFLAMARGKYVHARDAARAALKAPCKLPPGGAYLWVDLRAWGDDCLETLGRIAEAGVLLAPGHAFGDGHGGFARLCFTGVTEDRLLEGIERINRVL